METVFAKGLAQAELVNSPLRFLDEAVDEAFTRFVVMADEQAAARADELIELCATLRHNSHTRATPLDLHSGNPSRRVWPRN